MVRHTPLPLPLKPVYICVTDSAARVEIEVLTWLQRLLSGKPWRATREKVTPRVHLVELADRDVWFCHPRYAPGALADARGTIEITRETADELATLAYALAAEDRA